MKFIILALICTICFCKKQTVLNSKTSDYADPKLQQIVIFYRHGNYILDYLFLNGEYDAYDIETPQNYNPTFLGNSQSWSLGSYLRLLHSEFFEDVDSSSDFLFLIGAYKRSLSNAEHLSSGLVGNYPDWSYDQISNIAIDAVSENGICGGCPTDSYVPIGYLSVSKFENSTVADKPLIEIQEDNFFDIDECCDYIPDQLKTALKSLTDLIEEEFGITYDEEEFDDLVDSLIVLSDDADDSIGIEMIIGMYEAHTAHGLRDLNLPQKNLQELLNLDIYEWTYETVYETFFDEDKFMSKLYDSSILESCINNLYGYVDNGENKKVVAYLMHDNNLYALLHILMSSRPEYPYYAENLILKIYSYINSNGEEVIYVNTYFNHEEFTINGCDFDCPISDLVAIFENNIIDVESFCDQYENLTQLSKSLTSQMIEQFFLNMQKK